MQDYRVNYIVKQAESETFTIEIKGDRFMLHGSAGTTLEMKPIIPGRIEVDQGDSVMIITKNKMIIRNKPKERPLEQTKMEFNS